MSELTGKEVVSDSPDPEEMRESLLSPEIRSYFQDLGETQRGLFGKRGFEGELAEPLQAEDTNSG